MVTHTLKLLFSFGLAKYELQIKTIINYNFFMKKNEKYVNLMHCWNGELDILRLIQNYQKYLIINVLLWFDRLWASDLEKIINYHVFNEKWKIRERLNFLIVGFCDRCPQICSEWLNMVGLSMSSISSENNKIWFFAWKNEKKTWKICL